VARPNAGFFDIGAYETVHADATPPQVSSRSPANGATGVPISSVVTVTFNEPVQAGTIQFSLTRSSDNAVIAGTFAYDASTRTATFSPAGLLSPSTGYTVTVDSAQDLAGNPMAAAATWGFTTAAPDSIPPTVSSRTPAVGATGVAPTTNITATFSEAVQPSTIQFTLVDADGTPVAGSVTYDAATRIATFDPSVAQLRYGSAYVATVN